MGAHYLIDLFGNPVGTASIIDVRDPTNAQSVINGCFVVRLPDGVPVNKPTTFNDLITKKYQGMLAFYAGFTRLTRDDLVDASGIDLANSSGIAMGQRASISLAPGGIFQSVVVPLTGGVASQFVITWETFQFTDADPATDRFQRTYVEVPSSPSNVTCSVSFNSGGSFNATTDGNVITVLPADQGTNFVLRLTNASSGRLYLGSWAIVY